MTFSFKLGYIIFRKIMSSFQSMGLPLIINYMVEIMKRVNYDIAKNSNALDLEIFSFSIKTFYSCLTFNYNLSFYEYETDSGIAESSYIMVILLFYEFIKNLIV